MIISVNHSEQLQRLSPKQELISLEKIVNDFKNNPFAKYLLELEKEEIVGFLYYSDIYDRAEINQLEVKSSHRNCGKASKLLEEMIKLVDKSITLEVKEDNLIAIHLYKKFGFQEIAIRQSYYHGTDGILMERKRN